LKHPIPIAALDDRLAYVGTAGSGKTYNAGSGVELLLDRSARVVIADPLGVWWGLRLRPDGKTPSPYNVVIFGGPHGDIAINEHAGALIGETVAGMAESCIVDLSQIGTKAGERRFMLAFLTALYRKTGGEPMHLVIDEADMFAPQRLMDKDGDAARLLGMMETIVRRGRVKGFIPWLITQRPAVLSKDVLSQADGMVAFKLTASQDRSAIGAWIEGQADQQQGKQILASLPSMQRGQGVVWVPGRSILETATFPEKRTFDSSRTPKRGEKKSTAALKPLDLGALKDRLSTIEAETKANDPKALKAEIATLKRDLAAKPVGASVTDPRAVADAERRGYECGLAEGLNRGESRAKAALSAVETRLKDALAVAGASIASLDSPLPTPVARPIYAPRPATAVPFPTAPRVSSVPRASSSERLPPGELAVLIAAAQFGSVEREQLTILTGYKRSSRDAYIQRLREKQFITVSGSSIIPTDSGLAALPPDYEPLPTGEGLQSYWLAKLPEGERRVLEVLISAYPKSVERSDIDAATGYQRSSRDAYLQRMKAKRLWEKDGGAVRASEVLFG
jgi:hypothetical protein